MKSKIFKSVIALSLLTGLSILGYFSTKLYSQIYGEKYRWNISENIIAIVYNNGETGIYNRKTLQIKGRYDKILSSNNTDNPLSVSHSVIVVVKNGLRGYLSSETGDCIFQPQFLRAWIDDAESHLAAAVNKDSKLGFVNVLTKEVVIPFQYYFDEGWFIQKVNSREIPYYDFVFRNGICIVPGLGGKIGLIDKTGKLILPVVYSDIINLHYKDNPNYIIQKEEKFGLLDSSFNVIIPIEYDEIFYDHSIYILCLDGKYGVLDDKYKTILPIEFDWINYKYLHSGYTCNDDYNYCIIAQKDYVQKLYDHKGNIVYDFYIENDEDVEVFKPFYENNKPTAYIRYYLDGRYGIIDESQNVIIPAEYYKIEYIGNGNFVCSDRHYSFIKKIIK